MCRVGQKRTPTDTWGYVYTCIYRTPPAISVGEYVPPKIGYCHIPYILSPLRAVSASSASRPGLVECHTATMARKPFTTDFKVPQGGSLAEAQQQADELNVHKAKCGTAEYWKWLKYEV